MPRFHVFLRGLSERRVIEAPDPKAARATALERHHTPIQKVKLYREAAEPTQRAPRQTRRELQGEA